MRGSCSRGNENAHCTDDSPKAAQLHCQPVVLHCYSCPQQEEPTNGAVRTQYYYMGPPAGFDPYLVDQFPSNLLQSCCGVLEDDGQ